MVRIMVAQRTRNESRAAKAVATNTAVTASEQDRDTTEAYTTKWLAFLLLTRVTKCHFTLLLELGVDTIGVLSGQLVFVLAVAD